MMCAATDYLVVRQQSTSSHLWFQSFISCGRSCEHRLSVVRLSVVVSRRMSGRLKREAVLQVVRSGKEFLWLVS